MRGGFFYHKRDNLPWRPLHYDMKTWCTQFALGTLKSKLDQIIDELTIEKLIDDWL